MLLLKLFLLSATPIASLKAELLTLFINVFKHRAIDISKFSLIIDVRHICYFLASYEIYVESYFAVINNICSNYRFFFDHYHWLLY